MQHTSVTPHPGPFRPTLGAINRPWLVPGRQRDATGGIDVTAGAPGLIRVGGQPGVVDAELVYRPGRDPVVQRAGRLDDPGVGKGAIAVEELRRVDDESLGAADDDPGDDRTAGLVALGVDHRDARPARCGVPVQLV